MEHGAIQYNSLLIIILLATFVPVLIKKIRWVTIPIVVGEIIAGMIVGKSGFNLIEQSSWLNFLYTFGFAFLMFLSGLEVDFRQIRSLRSELTSKWYKKPVSLAVLLFLATITIGGVISYIFKSFNLIQSVPLMTLILSTTSLGIVVPTLKEKGFLNTGFGQVILLSALIADFMTMVLVTLYISFYTSAATYRVLLVLLLFVFFFIFYRMGQKIIGNKIIEELAHATSQIKVRGAFSLILIFIALAQALGTEIILGTFLAGLIVSLLDERDSSQLYHKLDAIGYGFFIPIFFIMVGANFDISFVIQNPKSIYLLPALLISAYLVKVMPALLLKINFTWKESISAGFLLSSKLSLIIATSAIGLKLNMISKETNGIVILVAIITCTFSPLIFNKLMPTSQVSNKKSIFIFGVKQKTLLLANRLQSSEIDVSFITHNYEEYSKGIEQNHKVYFGNAVDHNFLGTIGIKNSDVVVISRSSDEIALEITRICKEVFGVEHIMLLANNQSSVLSKNKFGATLISPEFASVIMAENMISHPKTFSLLLDNEEDDFKISEVYLRNTRYINKPIRKIQLAGDCLIVSILRNTEKIIPHGNTVLLEGDLIMIVGTKEHVKESQQILKRR